MSEMIATALELLFECIVAVVWWILLHLIVAPFLYLVGTPLVLVVALFGAGTYAERVRSGYRAITEFCFAF